MSHNYWRPHNLSSGIYLGAQTETAHGNRSSQNITCCVLTGVVALNDSRQYQMNDSSRLHFTARPATQIDAAFSSNSADYLSNFPLCFALLFARTFAALAPLNRN